MGVQLSTACWRGRVAGIRVTLHPRGLRCEVILRACMPRWRLLTAGELQSVLSALQCCLSASAGQVEQARSARRRTGAHPSASHNI